jgi:hypothetical protein
MIIEEVLHGLPSELREVTVETSAGTSCYMRLRKDERYVIYGRRVPGAPFDISRNACSFSFRLTGNETLLSALRQAETRATSRLVGKVQMNDKEYDGEAIGAGGVRVAASNGVVHLETSTNNNGEFEFLNIAPGKYHLTVTSPDVFEDEARWPSGDPTVAPFSCGDQNLSVWPNGRIEGTLQTADGKALRGVPVQAFTLNLRGQLNSSPFREQKTDDSGRYSLSGLPPGDVVVGVNGEEYHDRLPWAPTFYSGTADRDKAVRLSLGRGERKTGIDLQLPMARKPATLHVEALMEDGTPALGAIAKVENIAGIQRAFASEPDSHTNILHIPVYIGETYNIKSFQIEVKTRMPIRKESQPGFSRRRGVVGPAQCK